MTVGVTTALHLGDCLEAISTIRGANVVVVTDPPYGVQMGVGNDRRGASGNVRRHGLAKGAYSSYEDTYENFVGLIVPRLNAALDVSIRGAVFTGPHMQEQRKATAIGGVYCPVGSGRHAWGFKTFHPVLFYGKAPELNLGARPTILKDNGRAEKNGHPCPKPLAWMRWLVELVSRPGDIILDPFMGSGTTGVACVDVGRDFIGCEVDPAYFQIAEGRIQDAQASRPLLSAMEAAG